MIHKCLILTKEILELALKIGPIPGFHFIDVMFDFHLEDMAILLRYGYLFIVAIFAGIRQGELLGLPWENVDFVRMTITIDRQLQKNKEGYFFCTPKNGTARSFAVAPVMMEALKKENEKQENLHNSKNDFIDSDVVCCNKKGQQCNCRTNYTEDTQIIFPESSVAKRHLELGLCRPIIQYNEKSWNSTPFRASFQHKKEIPDLKLYQVWYLFWRR